MPSGNKATLVENRSARIQTNTGDLIIRSETLNNIRDVLTYEWKDISPNSTAFVNLPQSRTISAIRHASGNITTADVIYWDATLGGKWFGTANFNQSDWSIPPEKNIGEPLHRPQPPFRLAEMLISIPLI